MRRFLEVLQIIIICILGFTFTVKGEYTEALILLGLLELVSIGKDVNYIRSIFEGATINVNNETRD